jgi:hypothetical protein
MGSVLGEQQRAGNDEKSNKHQSGFGLRGHALSRLFLMTEVILRRHRNAPSDLAVKLAPLPLNLLTQIKNVRLFRRPWRI